MKKFLFLLVFMPLVLVGCEKNAQEADNDGILYPVSGRTYIEEKYGGTELHFAKKGNSLVLVEHSEAGTTDKINQYFIMIDDTIRTYNNTKYDDVRNAYIYHDTYLTSWWSYGQEWDNDYRLIEQ